MTKGEKPTGLTQEQLDALNNPDWKKALKTAFDGIDAGLDPEDVAKFDKQALLDATTASDPDKPVPPLQPVTKSA
jgi:hypothetical protein